MLDLTVAYDVAEDDRRARLSALLSKHGMRIQFSVFHCQLEDGGEDKLVEAIRALIDENEDLVHIFPRCADCSGGAVRLGLAREDLDVGYWVV